MGAAREHFIVEIGEKRWIADVAYAVDLSIPMHFDGAQPSFFAAPAATAKTLEAGSFIGDVRRGGSCNCSSYSLTPHCNGTHTECVGHVTADAVAIRDISIEHFSPALLITVTPEATEATQESSEPGPHPGDRLITRKALQASVGAQLESGCRALVIRTFPNDSGKRHRNYDDGPAPPYFSAEAMRWIVERNIRHLVVDLPSLDRNADAGRLTAHRIFWGLPRGATNSAEATRRFGTVTEFAYIDASIPDGQYLLNLQVPPFMSDAAPSRPILYPLVSP